MEDINLHFTGDFHAIGAANNLLAAMLDNHIQQGNALGIDPRRITWRRCVDMNDRQLRNIVDGLGGTRQRRARARTASTSPWPARSWPSSASPPTLPISRSGLARIVVALHLRRRARHRGAICTPQGAMAALLQGRAASPTSCRRSRARPRSSTAARLPTSRTAATRVIATRMALKLARLRRHRGGLRRGPGRGEVPRHQVPHGGADALARCVIVATVRALKMPRRRAPRPSSATENLDALEAGLPQPAAAMWTTCKNVFGLPVRGGASTASRPTPTRSSRS